MSLGLSDIFTSFGLFVGRPVEVIDLLGDLEGVLQFFAGMLFQFLRDVVVFRAFHGLAVNDVSDNGLVFARQIFIEQIDHLLAGDFGFVLHI